jgi:hypothetical protein
LRSRRGRSRLQIETQPSIPDIKENLPSPLSSPLPLYSALQSPIQEAPAYSTEPDSSTLYIEVVVAEQDQAIADVTRQFPGTLPQSPHDQPTLSSNPAFDFLHRSPYPSSPQSEHFGRIQDHSQRCLSQSNRDEEEEVRSVVSVISDTEPISLLEYTDPDPDVTVQQISMESIPPTLFNAITTTSAPPPRPLRSPDRGVPDFLQRGPSPIGGPPVPDFSLPVHRQLPPFTEIGGACQPCLPTRLEANFQHPAEHVAQSFFGCSVHQPQPSQVFKDCTSQAMPDPPQPSFQLMAFQAQAASTPPQPQVVYVQQPPRAATMPSKNSSLAPQFNSSNPRNLLCYFRDMDHLLDAANVQDAKSCKDHAKRYLEADDYEIWDSLSKSAPGYLYEEFRQAVIDSYPGAEEDCKYNLRDVTQVTEKWRKAGIQTTRDLGEYYCDFRNVTTYLIGRGRIAEMEQH